MTLSGLHHCPRCEEWLPADHFRPNERMRDGLHSYCRICAADLARDWRERNREAVERYNDERRETYAAERGSLERICANPECSREFTATRRDAKTCSRRCRDRLSYLRRKGTRMGEPLLDGSGGLPLSLGASALRESALSLPGEKVARRTRNG